MDIELRAAERAFGKQYNIPININQRDGNRLFIDDVQS